MTNDPKRDPAAAEELEEILDDRDDDGLAHEDEERWDSEDLSQPSRPD